MGLPISKLGPLFAALCTSALLAASAVAQVPAVAILEEIAGASGKHEAFDELKAGERLDLGANGRAVIGYLSSCARETIEGGTVVVGKDQSKIEGGKVARETIPCEATQLVLTEEEAGKSGVFSTRDAPWVRENKQILPSASPLILVATGGQLKIKRRDSADEEILSLPIKDGKVDLAALKIALQPGGYYELQAGKKKMVIQIHSEAQPGSMPAMSRLVRL